MDQYCLCEVENRNEIIVDLFCDEVKSANQLGLLKMKSIQAVESFFKIIKDTL